MSTLKKTVKPQELEERLIDFASRVLDMVDSLPKIATAKYLGTQIMRSGTAPALNYGEVQAAESHNDFVHKLKICLKELRETFICLRLIERRNCFKDGRLSPLLKESNELIAIFVASLKTLTNNQSHPPKKS